MRSFATASLDISDGLIGDLSHVTRTSGVSAIVEAGRIPLSDAARALMAVDPTVLGSVLTGGDDYEILTTMPADRFPDYEAAAARAGIAVTRIGRVIEGEGAPTVIDAAGAKITLGRASHDHF